MRVLRFVIHEDGQGPLPELDVADDVIVLGSGVEARVRLPAAAARAAHVRIDGTRWTVLADAIVDGVARHAGDAGELGAGVELALGALRVTISPAPAGAQASPPQRTESLARELVRSMLGSGAAPSLEVERGPRIGAKRQLPPPVALLVIGRGDEASWVILDEDLSRTHAELRRGWDGVTIRDLGSKNGTRVDGVAITDGQPLRDGQTIELGKVTLRYRDPAERHLRGEDTPAPAPVARALAPASVTPAPPAPWTFAIAVSIAALALAGLVWVLAS